MKCEGTLLATYEIRCEQQQRPAFHTVQSGCASSLFFCFQGRQHVRSQRQHPRAHSTVAQQLHKGRLEPSGKSCPLLAKNCIVAIDAIW